VTTLTASSFDLLLASLDANDRSVAAEKYELLRIKLVKCFTWRKNCPESEADGLADTVLDRVALKIAQGEKIQNINAYACTILDFVWKEHYRRHKEDAVGFDRMPEKTVELNHDEIFVDPDLRTRCLRKCVAEVVPDQNEKVLIVGYYDLEAGDKLKDIRKNLADKLGVTLNTLKVKAFRIRDRLEKCINECVSRLSVTKTNNSVTNTRGGNVD
jgi:DNA-directed RNA polymerase specialized sigma24 family protein